MSPGPAEASPPGPAMTPIRRLQGKVAVITGAGSGIGQATAALFAAEGARVVLTDRNAEGLAATRQRIEQTGGTCRVAEADVTDGAAAERVTGEVVAAWGTVDALVTAAGIGAGGNALDTSEADWERVFSVNVKGTWLWAKAVLPAMLGQGRGAIVTIASQLAVAGGRNNTAYVASKGAVISLTKALALDFAAQGVRANVILPGATETPMLERAMRRRGDEQAARADSRSRHAMGRFGKPEEIAQAALYLASDDAGFTTGAVLPVDGGWLVA